jgi:outer membrane immunogenic protein
MDLGSTSTQTPPVGRPVPVQNWTGLYSGNAGYSWGRTDLDYTQDALPPLTTTLDPNSFIGGNQIGYNWQYGSLVLGIEGDIWHQGTGTATFTSGNIFGDFASFNTEQNWVGTVRPRVGFAANNWLLYGTGGVAFAGVKPSITDPQAGVMARATADSGAKAGWAAGAGVEYAFANHWSLGVEYLYMDFGTTTMMPPMAAPLASSTANFDDKSHVLRAKLNYKFDWATPITPKN